MHKPGSVVWVNDVLSSWTLGQVISRYSLPRIFPNQLCRDDAKRNSVRYRVKVKEHGGEMDVGEDMVTPFFEESLKDFPNMVELEHLNEATVLQNLRLRYSKGAIYVSAFLFFPRLLRNFAEISQTYVERMLVCVNPYEQTRSYAEDVISRYAQSRNLHALEPHVFGLANDVYQAMISKGYNHSVLIKYWLGFCSVVKRGLR